MPVANAGNHAGPLPFGENTRISASSAPIVARRENRRVYVRRLDHWYTPMDKAKEAVGCGYCGGLISEGTWTTVQKFYAWPEPSRDAENEGYSPNEGDMDTGAKAAGLGAAGATRRMHTGKWHNLTSKTQRKFRTSGLGRGLGSRSPRMAQRLYERSVPEAIRLQGEKAVLNFTNGKHPSHKVSVYNKRHWAKRPSNVLWENAKKNLSRGKKEHDCCRGPCH